MDIVSRRILKHTVLYYKTESVTDTTYFSRSKLKPCMRGLKIFTEYSIYIQFSVFFVLLHKSIHYNDTVLYQG